MPSLADMGFSTATLAALHGAPAAPRSAARASLPLSMKQSDALFEAAAASPGAPSPELDVTAYGITSVEVKTPFKRPAAAEPEVAVQPMTPVAPRVVSPVEEGAAAPADLFAPVTEEQFGAMPHYFSLALSLQQLNAALASIHECIQVWRPQSGSRSTQRG